MYYMYIILELPDLIAGLVSLFSLIIFVQYWKPPYRPEFEAKLNLSPVDSDDVEGKKVDEIDSKSNNQNHKDYQSTAIVDKHTDNDKIQIESRDNLSQLNSTDTDLNNNEDENNQHQPTKSSDVQKTTLLESAIAWSPWLIIVVVVIV